MPKTYKRGTKLTTEEKIDYITGLMYSGVWRRGGTAKLLAKEWNLSPEAVRRFSAEASRVVKRHIMDPDSAAVDVTLAIREALEGALEDSESLRLSKEGLKARDQVIAACKAYSDIVGVTAPIRVEVDTKKATPEAARELMRKMCGNVTPGDSSH